MDQSGAISTITSDSTEVTISFTSMPSKFTALLEYDIVGHRSPNKIKIWDIRPTEVNASLKYIKFNLSDIEDVLGELKVGDYVCQAEESPVPNIPTEMHPVLAQLTAVHALESLGDTEGLSNAQRRLERMEKSVMQLVDDRVELAPKKIKPRNGTLSETRTGYYGRKSRG